VCHHKTGRKFLNYISKITMSYTDKHIVETYSGLFEGLSSLSKIELIESLSKSLKSENTKKESKFYKSFGAFASEKSAEEIIADIKSSRKFGNKEIKF
jgi:hypothetical protein